MLILRIYVLLVPTRVGMILPLQAQQVLQDPCPHTRGDDPVDEKYRDYTKDLSPHAWG